MYHKKNRIAILFIFLFFANNSFSQVISDKKKAKYNYKEIDIENKMSGFNLIEAYPMYPNGTEGVDKLFRDKIGYPKEAIEKGIEGEVIVQYTIDINGEVIDIKILKSLCPSLNNEVLRVFKYMKKWEPAYQNGKPIKFTLSQTINFTLPRPVAPKRKPYKVH